MDSAIFVATISASASILVAALTFFLTKKKEREAEFRKQKLEHYKEFLDALSGTVGTDSTPENQRRWARASNTMGLVASQDVLKERMSTTIASTSCSWPFDEIWALHLQMIRRLFHSACGVRARETVVCLNESPGSPAPAGPAAG